MIIKKADTISFTKPLRNPEAHAKIISASTTMPSQVQLMSISFSLTEFYHIYTSIHNKQILIPPQFEKVFHCSIHTSKIFLGTVAIQHAKLGTVVHNNIIITHSDSGIWNIKILAKFQLASRRIYLVYCLSLLSFLNTRPMLFSS